jgi:hypothetical protein
MNELERTMAKRTTITIETTSLLILRSRSSRAAYCPTCAGEVEMIAMEDTGAISNLDRAALELWLTSSELHRAVAPDGSSLVCLNSLLARLSNTKPANRGIPRLLGTEKEKT